MGRVCGSRAHQNPVPESPCPPRAAEPLGKRRHVTDSCPGTTQIAMNIQSVILYTTASHEYRVPQVRYFAKSLRDAGFDTTVAGPLGPSCKQELEQFGVQVRLKPLSPVLTRLKLYNLARLLDVVLEPGEALFLPVGWWHQVQALDFSISATYTNFTWTNEAWLDHPQRA